MRSSIYDHPMRALLLVALLGCGGGSSDTLIVATTFTVSELSGQGPSHLDVLNNQSVAIQIRFDSPAVTHDPVGGCPTTSYLQSAATTAASGSAAAMVRTEILDYLPDWIVRISICANPAQSSVQLSADNFMNTGFTVGCIPLPASADFKDGDGNPVFSSFMASGCTLTILDASTNRVVAARDFSMTVAD